MISSIEDSTWLSGLAFVKQLTQSLRQVERVSGHIHIIEGSVLPREPSRSRAMWLPAVSCDLGLSGLATMKKRQLQWSLEALVAARYCVKHETPYLLK
jgi:hypothetical protein